MLVVNSWFDNSALEFWIMIFVFDMNTLFDSPWSNFSRGQIAYQDHVFSGKKSNGAQIMDVLFLQNNTDSSVQELSAPLPLSAEGDNFPSQILKI